MTFRQIIHRVFIPAAFFFMLPPLSAVSDVEPVLDMVVPGDKIEDREGRGLFLRSNPAGARIFIDGIERGVTPLRIENLGPGRYYVRLVKEGYVERSFRVSLRSGSMADITVELEEAKGRVLVNVSPAPGSPGNLPLTPVINADGEDAVGGLLTLRTGIKTVIVRAFGWEEASVRVYVSEGSFQVLDVALKPAVFTVAKTVLSRPRFNPENSGSLGTTEFRFEVNAPGRGTFSVYNASGSLLYAGELASFTTWSQAVSWNGRDSRGKPFPDGEYSLELKAGPAENPARKTVVLKAVLDSAVEIRPLSVYSGKAGLLYAPTAALLPPGSFQVDGGLLFGKPAGHDSAWKSLPFAGAFRFSPLSRLEISAALDVLPVFSGGAALGAGVSAKWLVLNPAEGPFGAAAGAVFSWAGGTSVTPFGMGSGIELFFPLQARAGRIFSFVLAPACIWTGEDGFPWDPVPRVLVSGGVMACFPWATAGISARGEFPLTAGTEPSVMFAGEIKCFPPPSSFVFSLMGGFRKKGSASGGFGGAGIGLIY
jgi:hypothetical protein